jgi:hypothetical protein
MKNYCRAKLYKKQVLTNLFILLGIIPLIYSSCKKEMNTLAVDFINPDSTFNIYFETVGLNAHTSTTDSLPTHRQSLYILGAINDPVFGVSRASILTTYSIPNNASSFSLGTNGIVDSVVLQLNIGNDSTLAGNINAFHNIKVYELDETLLYDSVYFSNRKYKSTNTPIGEFNGVFSPIDSISNTYVNSSLKIPPSIRIKLSESFRDKIEKQKTFDKDNFSNLFKGFAVVDESNFAQNDGGFWYLYLNSAYTSMVVYYKNDTTNLRAEFKILDGNPHYNYYQNSSSNLTTPFTTRFNPAQKTDIGYLQSLAGTSVRVFIPDSVLNRLASEPLLAVQKADLIVNALDGFSNNTFKLPNQLTLLKADSTGRRILTEDSNTENLIYIGGNINNGQYRFNIAREINYLLKNLREGKGNMHYGLTILVPNSTTGSIFQTTARRVVLDTKNMKLKLNYTVIK